MANSIAKMIVMACLVCVVSGDRHKDFSVSCGPSRFNLTGEYAKNVAFVIQNLLKVTPNTGEKDFQNKSATKPVVFGAAHCFNSKSAESNVTCFNCLNQAIDALKADACANGIQATSGSATAGCTVKYDQVPVNA